MKKHNFYLSEKEEAVMLALWGSDKPLSATDIANIIDTEWAYKSIQNTIKKLFDTGLIEISAIAKVSKTYGRFFSPTVTKEEYTKMQLERVYNNNSVVSLALRLIGKKNTSTEFSEKLQKLLDEYGDK